VDGRFRILEQLGRGGMARVYRAQEIATQRAVALKQLHLPTGQKQHAKLIAMFEREYHTLTQLAHPRVVEVYDYGVDDTGPYYTMELLDRGDLRDRAPLPWRTTCSLSFDVCSALALVHSRRLVHRDLSPRNVRCTDTEHAKLIDFGALAAVGPSSQVVGTPPFIAPEVLDGGTLDARTDLYSLGATIYFALTGRSPYLARTIAELVPAWRTRAAPPSNWAPGVPPELDALVMELLNLDPASRPSSAFEVMERLASIANLDRSEPASVSRAYLRSPTIVGREETLSTFRAQLSLALAGRGGGLFFEAASGLGRSRLLDACAVEAKTAGATVLRASASEGRFAAARTLAQLLLDACPELAISAALAEQVFELLFEASAHGEPDRVRLRIWNLAPADEIELHAALERWFLSICQDCTLVIAIDDVDRVDASSLALLAALAHRAGRRHLLLCATALSSASSDAGGLDVLAGHCNVVRLRPLEAAETAALLASLFGDAANLALLSARIHTLAGGRPSQCIALCQHLIDRGLISYAAGSWTLPERATDGDLPASMEALFRERVDRLNPAARWLAQSQALATFGHFAAEDYAQLAPELTPQVINGLIAELVANEITNGDGQRYVLSHEAIRNALLASINERERRVHHRALADLYLSNGTSRLAAVRHLLAGSAPELALELLSDVLRASFASNELAASSGLNYPEIAQLLAQAHDAALIVGLKPRALNELRRWLILLSFTDPRYFDHVGPALLAQLEHDSGRTAYRDQDPAAEPSQRLMCALQRVSEQYAATAEDARVYDVAEAIKYLTHYCVASIAVGANTLNIRLLASLPELLEPFASLSPVLRAIWQNTLATLEGVGLALPERARARWRELYEQLAGVTEQELPHVTMVRSAVAFGVGAIEAQLGLESAAEWAAILDRDPAQRVNAMYLRKTVCMLRGDFDGAESFRRKAEVLGLQANATQMFTNLLAVELSVHAAARDLTGVKRVRDRIHSVAAKFPGWRVYQCLADAMFQRLRGELASASELLESALALCEPDASDPGRVLPAWPRVTSWYIETLLERKQFEAARAYGERALETCRELGLSLSTFEIERSMALAEAHLNDHATAEARLERLIASQLELGVTGLHLGLSYEARARVAISAADSASLKTYLRLTAEQYGHQRGSSLGGRYERLLLDARAAGCSLPAHWDDTNPTNSRLGTQQETFAEAITQSLDRIASSEQLALQALQLLCDVCGSGAGHLFVMRRGELVHAASYAAESPSEALQDHVREFWTRQLEETDMPTQLVPASSSSEVLAELVTADAANLVFQPVLLRCSLAGSFLHVGVVLVMSPELGTTHSKPTDALNAVAHYFVRKGLASGVVA
jgi:hypothetical protein